MTRFNQTPPNLQPRSAPSATSSNSSTSAQCPVPQPTPGLRDERCPILVHSHLRWDWVWQRPQQFLSRLSSRHPILFIEEPFAQPGLPRPRAELLTAEGFPNITILRPAFPAPLLEERAARDHAQKELVDALLAGPLGTIFTEPLQWFYDPMAAPAFARQMAERAIVYDCMDQLSQFRGAHPELVRREHNLLGMADIVFAGGPKIHRAKKQLNPNCHCYGCGVDVAHFGQALRPETPVPAELARLPKPALGYFGVVDERIDYQLVDALAAAHPEWSVVMIGPATKVDPALFPRRPNLHWLGGRDYRELPGYVKGLDVCLMPFALNEATEFINPTKALEYMASGRPIVSTAIEDVVLQFSEVVDIARSHGEFIAACERAIAAPCKARLEAGRELAAGNSWDSIVAKLEEHLAATLASGPTPYAA